jgi:hypothetical protein
MPARSFSVSYDSLENVDGVTVCEEECTRMVYPSGSDFATAADAMVPLAPTRFSGTTVCPTWRPTSSITMRAMMSVALPTPKGMITLMGWAFGQSWASAAPGTSKAATATMAQRRESAAKRMSGFLLFMRGQTLRV